MDSTQFASPSATSTNTFFYKYILSDHSLDPRWEIMGGLWPKSPATNLVADAFTTVFEELERASLQEKLSSFGGCFAFGPQSMGTKLSTHPRGIAIDLNPETNQQGTTGQMDSKVITVFKQLGFTWGGGWDGHSRDPMPFQFCSGY